jgi:branched-chain amino acid transport system permease protein
MKWGVILLAAVLALGFPFVASDFWVSTVVCRILILGTMALSLTFLASFAGLVSFAQMGIAGVAGYALALFSANSSGVGVEISWPLAVLAAIALATVSGFLVGVISIRSSGIYLLMITLAISVCMFYFTSQNTEIFNGADGVNGVNAPVIGTTNLRSPMPFYFLCLGIALGMGLLVAYLERTPIGSLLHAYRNAPLRLNALGFNVVALRLLAFSIAGFIAGAGGVLNTWYNGQISPAAVDVHAAVLLLIVAVIGGMSRPIGAFLGALVYILLENFAMELFERDRFNLVIGLTFMLIVSVSRDGLLGIMKAAVSSISRSFFPKSQSTIETISHKSV